MNKVNIKIAMLLLIVAMTIVACSSVGDTDDNSGSIAQPVRVTAAVANMQTRATDATNDNLSEFGLYISPDVNATVWNNSQVNKVSGAWSLATPITWYTDKTASAMAYAPYQTDSPVKTSDATMTLSANILETSEPKDWLYFHQATYNPKADTPLPVTFSHAMSRLRINISMNTELAGYSVTKVWVEGTMTKGTLTMLATPAVRASGDVANVFATHTDEAVANAWSAFLVPQNVSAGTLKIHITVSKDGKSHSYTYSHTAAATFEMGKAYGLSLTLGKYAVTLNGSGITGLTGWDQDNMEILE